MTGGRPFHVQFRVRAGGAAGPSPTAKFHSAPFGSVTTAKLSSLTRIAASATASGSQELVPSKSRSSNGL